MLHETLVALPTPTLEAVATDHTATSADRTAAQRELSRRYSDSSDAILRAVYGRHAR